MDLEVVAISDAVWVFPEWCQPVPFWKMCGHGSFSRSRSVTVLDGDVEIWTCNACRATLRFDDTVRALRMTTPKWVGPAKEATAP